MAASSSPRRDEGHGYGFPAGFDTKPWVVQFNKSPKPPLTLFSPFHGTRPQQLDVPALRGGRTCIGQDGDWWLMCNERSGQCFLISFRNLSSPVALPRLPGTPKPNCFGCTLSNHTPPDCTVLTTMYNHNKKSLWYCRPGSKKWSELPVILPRNPAPSPASSTMVVIDMPSCLAPPRVEMAYIDLPNTRPRVHEINYLGYMVDSCGDRFLIRLHLFGVPRVVVNIDACRWNPSRDQWDIIETIGDRTFFLGSKRCFAVSSARRAGTEPNCVHILMRSGCHRGFVIYTVSLEDMTIRLNVVEGCNKDLEAFWFVPSRLKQEASAEFVERREPNKKIDQGKHMNGVPSKVLGSSNESSQWSHLHTDLLELLVPRISFIDVLHLRAVCKHWSSISSSMIQHAKVFPLLVSTCPRRKDSLNVFDPVSKRNYTTNLNIPDDEYDTCSQMLWYSKNGWIIISRGCYSVYMVNPFKRSLDGVIVLPSLDSSGIKGVSFSSMPGSPDFLVITVQTNAIGTLVTVKTWKPGDRDWTGNVFNNNDIPFVMACHNPVFFGGNFYCLDINGRIGVFKPEITEWSVLEKPAAIWSGNYMLSLESRNSYLVEWKGELVAIFRADKTEEGAIQMYKFDRSQTDWSELDGLKDAVVFWDRKNALVRPPQAEEFCNKMFLPRYAETDGGRAPILYCFKSQQYYPSFYGNKELINALWFEPNLEYFQ